MKSLFLSISLSLIAAAAFAGSGAPAVTRLVGGVVARDGVVYPKYATGGKVFLGGQWFTEVPEEDRVWNALNMTTPAEYCAYLEGTENYSWGRENFGDYYGPTQLDIFNNYYMSGGRTEEQAIRQMTMDFLGFDGYLGTMPILDTDEGKATFVSEIEAMDPQVIHNVLSFSNTLFYPRDNDFAKAVVGGYARNPDSDPSDIMNMLSLLVVAEEPPLEIDMRNSYTTREELQGLLDNMVTGVDIFEPERVAFQAYIDAMRFE